MAETYDVEISISGGCVLWLRGSNSNQADSLEVLIVDGSPRVGMPEHVPTLTFRAFDWLELAGGAPLAVGNGGHQLTQRRILASADGPTKIAISHRDAPQERTVTFHRATHGQQVPKDDEDEWCLDWIPDLRRANVNLDPGKAVARISFPAGHLDAHAVVRDREEPWTFQTWHFVNEADEPVPPDQLPCAVAEIAVFRLYDLDSPLVISGLDGDGSSLRLDPRPAELLELSITNLPRAYHAGGIRHFGLYRRLNESQEEFLELQKAAGEDTPSSTCPPVRYRS